MKSETYKHLLFEVIILELAAHGDLSSLLSHMAYSSRKVSKTRQKRWNRGPWPVQADCNKRFSTAASYQPLYPQVKILVIRRRGRDSTGDQHR